MGSLAAGSHTSGAWTILSLRAITWARWPSAVCASARFRATLAKSRMWRIRTRACDHSDLLLRFLRESPLTSLEPTAGCSRDSRRAPRFVNAVFSPTLLNYGSRPIALPPLITTRHFSSFNSDSAKAFHAGHAESARSATAPPENLPGRSSCLDPSRGRHSPSGLADLAHPGLFCSHRFGFL